MQRSISLLIAGLLVLSLFTVTLSNGIFYAQAQRETFPDNVFASTSQGQLHELVLKATQENGQANAVPGFKVDLTNVVSTPANSDIAIFTTGAKVKTANTDTFIDLSKKNN